MRKALTTILIFWALSAVCAQVSGFPKNLGVGSLPLWGAPAVIQTDSMAYVVIGSTDESLYCYDITGSSHSGFPIALPGPVRAKVALEPDSAFTAVFAITTNGYLCRVNAYTDSASVLFSHNLGSSANYISPVLSDIDRNGDLELFAAVDTTLFCYSTAGDYEWSAEFYSSTGSAVATPAVGDIDGDGYDEIVVEGYEALFAFEHDGTPVDSFPVELDESRRFSYSSPLLWDYDNDGKMEIFCGAHGVVGSELGLVIRFDADSLSDYITIYAVPGAYGTWVYSSPALGDANGDYNYDMSFGSITGHVFSIIGSGAVASFGGAAMHMPMGHIYGGMILCDINQTPGPEFIFQMSEEEENSAYMIAMEPSAPYIEGFPDTIDEDNSGILTPIVFEWGESTYISAVTGDGELYLWAVPAKPLPGHSCWKELYGDRWNRGLALPYAPTLQVEEQDTGQYLVSWTQSDCSEFDAYRIYVSSDSAASSCSLLASFDDTAETSYIYESSEPAESIWFFVLVEDFLERTSLRSIPKSPRDTAGIAEVKYLPVASRLKIYPNPFNSVCDVSIKGAEFIEVLSIDGRLLRTIKLNGNSASFKAENLSSGILVFRARDSVGRVLSVEKAVLVR